MKDRVLRQIMIPLISGLLILFCSMAYAGNIDPDNNGSQYAWGENVGWINLQPSWGSGITVTNTAVTGMAWGENIGWINLSPTTGGVVNDGYGGLSGYAWSENAGWINFNPAGGGVEISANGIFSGYAWGENIGWINFAPANGGVKTSWIPDADGDGYRADADCDDNDATIYLGAPEICDGKDNDCNGQTDEGVKITYYNDSDSDGYGDPNNTTQACTPPQGYTAVGGDCNDNDPAINPGATEILNNGVDDDCNPATPINTVSGVGMNSPASLKWKATMSVNVNGSGPTGVVKYYYTRQRVSFQSTSITSVSASGGIATIAGAGNGTKIEGNTTTYCNGCTFTATIQDGSPDKMNMEIDAGNFYSAPGGLTSLDSGNFTVVGQ